MATSIPLAILFGAAALFSLYELIRFRARPQVESYIADREAQATHLLMNGGMAAMVSPLHGAEAARAIAIVYAAGVIVLAARLVLSRGRSGSRNAGTIYHLIGLAAMLYATRLMPMDMSGAAAMHGAPATTDWLAAALGMMFVVDGVATVVLAGFVPHLLLRMESAIATGTRAASASLAVIRMSAFPHVVMDAGMAIMLLPVAGIIAPGL